MDSDSMLMKQCQGKQSCGNELPLDEFPRKTPLLPGEVDLPQDHKQKCLDCRFSNYCTKMQSKTLEQHIARLVQNAKCRSLRRHVKEELLCIQEAVAQWHLQNGHCAICGIELKWAVSSPDAMRSLGERHSKGITEDFGKCQPVIDRIDASNDCNAYHNNMQFLCSWCNLDKAGWDCMRKEQRRALLLAQQVDELKCALEALQEGRLEETHMLELRQKDEQIGNLQQQVMRLAKVQSARKQKTTNKRARKDDTSDSEEPTRQKKKSRNSSRQQPSIVIALQDNPFISLDTDESDIDSE